jgi:DNA polymerase-4
VKLCPDLIIISSRYRDYSKISKSVMDNVHDLTPLVEQISIDEAFLDCTDLPETGKYVASQLQTIIRERIGLPCSLGVATNKLIAKIANNFGKASSKCAGPPNAITVIPPGQEASFLAPMPVEALWGVGPKTAERLAELGITTIGTLANYPEADLVRILGKHGHDLSVRSKGVDERPIITTHEVKSISNETTFHSDLLDKQSILRTLRKLSENVGKRLRRANKCGKTIKIKLRWSDFSTITRQLTLDNPTDQDLSIINAAENLFDQSWYEGKAVRLIGVGVSGFVPPIRQLTLWDGLSGHGIAKDNKLQNAIDDLRDRFGDKIVQRASDLSQAD